MIPPFLVAHSIYYWCYKFWLLIKLNLGIVYIFYFVILFVLIHIIFSNDSIQVPLR